MRRHNPPEQRLYEGAEAVLSSAGLGCGSRFRDGEGPSAGYGFLLFFSLPEEYIINLSIFTVNRN